METSAEQAPPPGPGAFLTGRAEDRVRDLLAFAMATDAGAPADQRAIEGYRRKADAELTAHAMTILQTRVQEIRRDAAAQAMARAGRPVGFWLVFLAALLAAVLVAATGAWLLAGFGLVLTPGGAG